MEIREDSANVKNTARVESSGFFSDSLISAGVVTLAIIGLVGILPLYMVAIGIIAMGSVFLLQSSTLGVQFSNVAQRGIQKTEAGTGITSEAVGGIGGIVLGILALLGIYANALIPIAIIGFGATLILSAGVPNQMNDWVDESSIQRESSRRMSRYSSTSISGLQFLVGLGGITLGILGLLGFSPILLSLVALIGIGGSELLSSGFVGVRTSQLSTAKMR
jgi:hypothetical protein